MDLGQGTVSQEQKRGLKIGRGPHKLLHITHGLWASIRICMLGTAQSIPSILDCVKTMPALSVEARFVWKMHKFLGGGWKREGEYQ